MALLRGGWNELMIAGFSHRSVGIQNGEMGDEDGEDNVKKGEIIEKG